MDRRPFPTHIGIIMDGNGRWAKAHGVPRVMGHNAGMQAMKKIVIASSNMGIKYLTVYAFSTENWKRSTEEVSGIFNLIVKYVNSELEELDENNVHINIFGEYDMLPKASVDAIDKMVGRLKDNDGLVFNIALNYGGRDEILRSVKALYREIGAKALEHFMTDFAEPAPQDSRKLTPQDSRKLTPQDTRKLTPQDTRKLTSQDTRKLTPQDTRKLTPQDSRQNANSANEAGGNYNTIGDDNSAIALNQTISSYIDEITEDDISEFLYSGSARFGVPDPDLIIRTSGEERMSNFLTWQSAYSELMFTDTLWPDFTPEEYAEMIESYANRDRRFGGRNKE